MNNVTSLLVTGTMLLFVGLGCSNTGSSSRSDTPPVKTGRTVANLDVKDPKARFLGEAAAYLVNLADSDQTMVSAFTSGSGASIKDGIIAASASERKDFDTMENAPKEYKVIADKLLRIHKDHVAAYTSYLQTFIHPKGEYVDQGNDLLKRSYPMMNDAKNLISAALDKDVAK